MEAFTRGLFEVVPEDYVKNFLPSQLQSLLYGSRDVDLEELSKNIEYRQWILEDQTIRWFWETLEEFNNEDRRRFLQFATGSASIRSRVGGSHKIKLMKGSAENADGLPVARRW